MQIPLAERLRPKELSDYVGQTHLVGEKGALTQMIQSGNLPPLVLLRQILPLGPPY